MRIGMPAASFGDSVGAAPEFAHVDNVTLIEPPFGDIANLNYLNCATFLYGDDQLFIGRLADGMSEALELPRAFPSHQFRDQLDRCNAYQSYAALFRSI